MGEACHRCLKEGWIYLKIPNLDVMYRYAFDLPDFLFCPLLHSPRLERERSAGRLHCTIIISLAERLDLQENRKKKIPSSVG